MALSQVTVLDRADGVLYSFACGEWLRESSGLFRLLAPTRVLKWTPTAPEEPADAAYSHAYGAPRARDAPAKSAAAAGGGALGFLRSLERDGGTIAGADGGGGGGGAMAEEREGSLERQMRRAEKEKLRAKASASRGAGAREHLTHYEFLIETRPPEPEPEPQVKDVLLRDYDDSRIGREARDARHLSGDRERLGLLGSRDARHEPDDPKLRPRHELDEQLQLDLKRADGKQSPSKSTPDIARQSVLTPSTVIRVRVEGVLAASAEPTATTTSASLLGLGLGLPAQQTAAAAEQKQQAGVLEHEFVLRLGQHFKQITRHRALVRLWNQPLIANIRSIRVACNKELYIERVRRAACSCTLYL